MSARDVVAAVNSGKSGSTGNYRQEIHENSAAETAATTSVRVRLHTPQRAITPGQAAVFYKGDLILGGGWIA